MLKEQFINVKRETRNEIKELAVFAEASKYAYHHFSTTADEIRGEKVSDNLNFDITIDNVIDLIVNDTITTRLYENVVVRSYGILEVYIHRVATIIVNSFPEKFLSDKNIKLQKLFEEDIDKLKQGYIDEAIKNFTSNKDMYESITKIVRDLNVNINLIISHESKIKNIYALRNLIVHKNCVVDKKFLEIYNENLNLSVGEKLNIEYKDMTGTVNSINQFINSIHKALQEKEWSE